VSSLYGYRRSSANPEAAETFFKRYDVENFSIVKDEHYWHAMDIVTEWFKPDKLIHPVHFTDLRWYPWKLSTSAERPFSVNKELRKRLSKAREAGIIENARLSFHNLFTQIFIYARSFLHNIKHGLKPRPHHIQLHVKPSIVDQNEPDKLRTVFGVSKTLIFSEAMFFWPLFSTYFTTKPTPLLWNYETLNGGWYRLNGEYHDKFKRFKTIFSLDWSEFDMRVYFSMWSDILQRLKSYFCFCGKYHPTHLYPDAQTNPRKLHRLWDWMRRAYFDSYSVTNSGKIYERMFAGMPSGIFCTQFIDSFYNCVMCVTVLLSMGIKIEKDHLFKVMGDDVIFGILEKLTELEQAQFLQDFEIEAKCRFNSKLNSNKSKISLGIQGASILSYSNWNGYPRRSRIKLLAQLLHPKSLRDTPPRLMARCIGIYYASAGDSVIRSITEQIYNTLKNQGFTPNPRGIHELFYAESILHTAIDLSHFPSRTEVVSRLLGPSQRSEILQGKYWPLEHFLVEAGSTLHN
jgi:hypothetical protein